MPFNALDIALKILDAEKNGLYNNHIEERRMECRVVRIALTAALLIPV